MKPKIKLKPWGREIWFAVTKNYAGKVLEVKKGARLSLQFHEKKEETQFLFAGKVRLTFGSHPKKLRTKILSAGDVFHIPPKKIHRVEGLAPLSKIFEVSTPELDDVIRLADDFGRSENNDRKKSDHRFFRGK